MLYSINQIFDKIENSRNIVLITQKKDTTNVKTEVDIGIVQRNITYFWIEYRLIIIHLDKYYLFYT